MNKETLYVNFIKEMVYAKASEFVGKNGYAYFTSIELLTAFVENTLIVTVKADYYDNEYTLVYVSGWLFKVKDSEGNEIYGARPYTTEPKTIEEIL